MALAKLPEASDELAMIKRTGNKQAEADVGFGNCIVKLLTISATITVTVSGTVLP